MPACSVIGCGSRYEKMEPGISFHRFPGDETRQAAWLSAINRSNWKPPKDAVVCSLHFDKSVLLINKNITRLARNACPTNLFPAKKPQKLNMLICLGCLSHDSKMFHLQAEDLHTYQRLFSETSLEEPQTSQLMCWECMASLKKVAHFSRKCLRAKNALVSLKDKLSPEVLSQARQILNLESNLTTILIQPMVHFETVKQEFEETSILKNEDYDSFEISQFEGENIVNNQRNELRRKIEENSVKNEDMKTDISRESAVSEYTDTEETKNVTKLTEKRNPLVYKAWIEQRKRELKKYFHFVGFKQEDMALEMLKRRKMMEKSKAPYKCQLCFKIFISERTYRNHWSMNHDETIGKYVCDVCGARRRARTALIEHLRRSHMFEFRCKLCSFTAMHFTKAWEHKQFHEGVTYVCEFCGKISNFKNCHQDRFWRLVKTKRFTKFQLDMVTACVPCKFRQMNVHYAHLQSSHNANTYHCLCCGQSFSSKQGLRVHVNKSSSCTLDIDVTKLETRQHCEKCDLAFANEQAISKHKRLIHEEKSKITTEKRGVYAQFRRYGPRKKPTAYTPRTDKEKIPCAECGRIYEGKRNFKLHLSAHRPTSHIKPKKFGCHRCGKYFTSTTGLQVHYQAVHHPETRKWQCKECPKTYKTVSHLEVHVRSIHRDFKFKCYHCEREYNTSAALYYHSRTFHKNQKIPRKSRSKKIVAKEEKS